jgi:hypothetical protein
MWREGHNDVLQMHMSMSTSRSLGLAFRCYDKMKRNNAQHPDHVLIVWLKLVVAFVDFLASPNPIERLLVAPVAASTSLLTVSKPLPVACSMQSHGAHLRSVLSFRDSFP